MWYLEASFVFGSGYAHVKCTALGVGFPSWNIKRKQRFLWLYVRPCFGFSLLKEGLQERYRGRLLTRACCDRTRGNDFKLKEWRFKLNTRRKFFTMMVVRHWHCCSERLWCSIPRGVQGQVGWGPGQPELMGGSPAHVILEFSGKKKCARKRESKRREDYFDEISERQHKWGKVGRKEMGIDGKTKTGPSEANGQECVCPSIQVEGDPKRSPPALALAASLCFRLNLLSMCSRDQMHLCRPQASCPPPQSKMRWG